MYYLARRGRPRRAALERPGVPGLGGHARQDVRNCHYLTVHYITFTVHLHYMYITLQGDIFRIWLPAKMHS